VSPLLIGYDDLAVAAILVVLNAVLTWMLDLGLSRIILIAGVRAVVQLLLVGLVLKTVFALASPVLIAAVALAMFAMASYEISSRQERRFAGAWGYGIGAGTTMLATLLVTAFALLGTLRPVPWYAPQILIPLLGIILGNVMNGVSVSLNALSTAVIRERAAIEARLALGTNRYTALKPLQRSALRSGIDPDHQSDVGCRRDHAARDDDRANPRRHGPGGGREISDPPPVSARRWRWVGGAGGGLRCHLANH
jgi:putative ABC transport system permease protein